MAINWTHLYKKYKGKWLALKHDEKSVVSFGETAKEAFSKAQKKGYQSPILAQMPDHIVSYVGIFS